MRQQLGIKKLRALRKETHLDIVAALVRGNTNHRIDLCLRDGSVVSKHVDGRLERSPVNHCVEPHKEFA